MASIRDLEQRLKHRTAVLARCGTSHCDLLHGRVAFGHFWTRDRSLYEHCLIIQDESKPKAFHTAFQISSTKPFTTVWTLQVFIVVISKRSKAVSETERNVVARISRHSVGWLDVLALALELLFDLLRLLFEGAACTRTVHQQQSISTSTP